MASLEELLAEEGFTGRKSMGTRASFRADTAGSCPFRDKNKTPSSCSGQRSRSRMDSIKYKEGSNSSRTSRDGPVPWDQKFDGRSTLDRLSGIRVSDGVREDKKVKDMYSDKGYEQLLKKNAGSDNFGAGSSNVSRRSGLKHQDPSLVVSIRDSSRGMRSSGSCFDDERPRPIQGNAQTMSSHVAIDEVAVKAMVSILNCHIKLFFNDKKFRIALHTNCISSFGISETKQDNVAESRVITALLQAIETAERAAEDPDSTITKDLKKACLQLTVITGLNSNETREGYTCGVPNSRLSACAHIYLSVIYNLQNKDRVSAKHLLQVFCASPSVARSLLLPHLWAHMFLPHFSHLRVWYDHESEHLQNNPGRMRKLKLLEKVYNEILDSGTFKFADYYKDWLIDGAEAPTVPSIHVPVMSVREIRHVGSSQDSSFGADYSPSGPFSPHPMVSKKLYESLFGRFGKMEDRGAGSSGEVDNFDGYAR